MKLTAAGVVVLGLVLAECSSGGGAAQSTVTATATVTTSAPTTSAPESSASAVDDTVGDAAACHILLDPLQIGTVTATGLDAILVSLSFPNGSGAEAVKAGRPSVVKALGLTSSPTLAGPLTTLLSYIDAYGTSAQPAAGVIGTNTAAIRAACSAVGVTAASS